VAPLARLAASFRALTTLGRRLLVDIMFDADRRAVLIVPQDLIRPVPQWLGEALAVIDDQAQRLVETCAGRDRVRSRYRPLDVELCV
jgi:hypothetical protein